jgi:hypothetical protein
MTLIEDGNPQNVNVTMKDKNGRERSAYPFGKIWKEGE